MKLAVFSVVFAVLASGCAMGTEGPEDTKAASFEVSEAERAPLIGVWKSTDGKHSMAVSNNGTCQLDEFACTYTVRATAPEGMPWVVALTFENGSEQSIAIEAFDANGFTATQGETITDFIQSDLSLAPAEKSNAMPESAGAAELQTIDAAHRARLRL
jgi:hypothetical protein